MYTLKNSYECMKSKQKQKLIKPLETTNYVIYHSFNWTFEPPKIKHKSVSEIKNCHFLEKLLYILII